jgi:uncharacterized membrane protein
MATKTEDAKGKAAKTASGVGDAAQSPIQEAVRQLVGTLTDRAVSAASDKVMNASGRLNDYAEGNKPSLLAAVTGAEKLADGSSPLKAAASAGWTGTKEVVKEKASDIKDKITGGGKGKGKKQKITNIVEQIDVGVPVDVAYDEWTQFESFPKFMKKLEQVEQIEDEKLRFKGQVFLSHRTWEATILEQIPGERIVWRSKGEKGYLDGAVTFHELTPDLTRIMVVIEYHPQGFFEKTGNLWRAQGRRIRLELKHFQRHIMTHTLLLDEEEIEGWRGEIRDSEVVDESDAEDEADYDDDLEDSDDSDRDEEVDDADEAEIDEDDADDADVDEVDDVEDEAEEEAPKRRTRARRTRSGGGARRRQGART